jgi:hypothetical protein
VLFEMKRASAHRARIGVRHEPLFRTRFAVGAKLRQVPKDSLGISVRKRR